MSEHILLPERIIRNLLTLIILKIDLEFKLMIVISMSLIIIEDYGITYEELYDETYEDLNELLNNHFSSEIYNYDSDGRELGDPYNYF